MTLPPINAPRHIHGGNLRVLDDLEWASVEHRPTIQQAARLPWDANLETRGSTLAARAGDYLVIGYDGMLYVVEAESFSKCYRKL